MSPYCLLPLDVLLCNILSKSGGLLCVFHFDCERLSCSHGKPVALQPAQVTVCMCKVLGFISAVFPSGSDFTKNGWLFAPYGAVFSSGCSGFCQSF